MMLFENDKTIEEIAKILNITDRAVYKWKRNPDFIQAQQEYAIFVLNTALPDSISELIKLIRNSKSDMVKLQAIQTVLKHANLLSDNSTPELDKARILKANADADYSEERVKAMKQLTNEDNRVLDDLLNKVHTGVIEDENEKSVD